MILFHNSFKLFCSAVCCLCLGCDMIYGFLNKEGAEEKKLIGEIIPNERNSAVAEIQILLKLYGYNSGNVDGALGGRTRDAIERFQEDNGLKPSRFVDKKTWEMLHALENTGLIIEHELNVKLIQKLLKKNGFNPGTIDGGIGPRTKDAVKAFQKAKGLKEDGMIGYQTLLELAELLPPANKQKVE